MSRSAAVHRLPSRAGSATQMALRQRHEVIQFAEFVTEVAVFRMDTADVVFVPWKRLVAPGAGDRRTCGLPFRRLLRL